MDDANSKPDGRDDGAHDEQHAGDGSTSSVGGLTLTDRDRALIIIAQEICGYLQSHREGDLEQIETRMSAYLATVGQCAGKDQG